MPNLQSKVGVNIWSIEKIKAGFDKFYTEHARLPTALEIDRLDYLPTSRTIQRSFGGLEQLRAKMGYQISHFGKGVSRSIVAKEANKRGYEAELEVYKLLKSQFGEMFVHIEKPSGNSSKQRLDFYVYSPSYNFGVDVFFPKDSHSLSGSVALKQISYKNFNEKLFFVMANNNILLGDLDKLNLNKKNRLKDNIELLDIDKFKKTISNLSRYQVMDA